MKKVGILGGTFDPIHKGHIGLALAAKEQFNLDMMWIMPTHISPHKQMASVTEDIHRLMMIERSLPDDSIEMNVMEFARKGKSFTSDTLTALHREHPDGEWYYIMGEDSLRDFPKWHEPEIIASVARIPVAIREEDESSFAKLLEERNKQYNNAFLPLKAAYQPVSSTMLRDMLRNGESTNLVASGALSYIRRFGLYGLAPTAIRVETMQKYRELVALLSEKLSEHRLSHCIGVAHLAADFMQEYEERQGSSASQDGFFDSVQQAFLAGILHDCAKYIPVPEYIAFCEQNNISVSASERVSPELLHAKMGAFFAKYEYGVSDPVILKAILKHCTGDVDMTPLELSVFTADFCEPFRDHRPIGRTLHSIRMMGYEDLTKAAWMATDCTIQYLKTMEWSIDPRSITLWNSLKNKTERN